jgi:hypothetical protein
VPNLKKKHEHIEMDRVCYKETAYEVDLLQFQLFAINFKFYVSKNCI